MPISPARRSTASPTFATRSSARPRGTPRSTSPPARWRRRSSREIGIEVAGEALPEAGADPAAVDEARQDRDTLGGRVEVRARGVPPGLGSYARSEDRLDARLAAALMGIQAVKGVEIGDGFALAGLRGSEAHDEIVRDERGLHRRRIAPAASRAASRTARRSSSAPR